MDVFDAIMHRRSIRRYEDRPISDKTIRELIGAAMMSPSAGNNRPWHFIIVTDRRILEDAIPRIHPAAGFSRHAAAAVAVCGDTSDERYGCYWNQDCSAATQTLLLAAHAKGIGACWCGVYPRDARVDEFRTLFNLPDHIMPLNIVTLGYPAEEKPSPDRFDAARVHRNTW